MTIAYLAAAAVALFVVLVVVVIVASLRGGGSEVDDTFTQAQAKIKEENLARSLSLARKKGEVTNNDIERLLGVSNATAERYLNELESRGHLVQVGKTGKGVKYKIR